MPERWQDESISAITIISPQALPVQYATTILSAPPFSSPLPSPPANPRINQFCMWEFARVSPRENVLKLDVAAGSFSLFGWNKTNFIPVLLWTEGLKQRKTCWVLNKFSLAEASFKSRSIFNLFIKHGNSGDKWTASRKSWSEPNALKWTRPAGPIPIRWLRLWIQLEMLRRWSPQSLQRRSAQQLRWLTAAMYRLSQSHTSWTSIFTISMVVIGSNLHIVAATIARWLRSRRFCLAYSDY